MYGAVPAVVARRRGRLQRTTTSDDAVPYAPGESEVKACFCCMLYAAVRGVPAIAVPPRSTPTDPSAALPFARATQYLGAPCLRAHTPEVCV